MAARRARLGVGHLLAWFAYALAGVVLTTDALQRPGAPVVLALGTACAVAAAALALLVAGTASHRVGVRTLLIAAAALAAAAAAGAGALSLLGEPPHLAVAAVLGFAAGAHAAAIRAAVVADPTLAPRVRPAPTLLAASAGAALAGAAPLLPLPHGHGWALVAAAVLQLIVIALATSATSAPATSTAISEGERAPAERLRPPLLALLCLAAAGAVALVALRPALSAIGADQAQPAFPLALTLVLGALFGPPLAMLAERAGGVAIAVLATVGGAAALAAPIARPGVLDAVAATLLGVALAASVALVELARRRGVRLARGAVVPVLLAGAAGAGLAALLLAAVPLPDVVLGASLVCLVAGLGAWAPSAARRPVR